jgi:hypothetical protein
MHPEALAQYLLPASHELPPQGPPSQPQPPWPSHWPVGPRLVVQVIPASAGPTSTHCCWPVVHEVWPTKQGAPGLVLQPRPAVQTLQPPSPLHTWPEPQATPASV